MLILGVETSCDETAAAVVEDGRKVLSSQVSSQIPLHEKFGGVVPEIACRAHGLLVVPMIEAALSQGNVTLADVSAMAVTAGPGLIGALLVGVATAKAIAWGAGIPLVGVDHLEAHVYANNLSHEVEYPFVTLLASGGHTALYMSESPLSHKLLGSTIDDAAGEAFDKASAILGLGYPGGPAIQKVAEGANAKAVRFPRTMLTDESLDFSFSGIKTAVLYRVKGQDAARPAEPLSREAKADVAASFQAAVVDVLVAKLLRAAERMGVRRVALSGGVAANRALREKVSAEAAARGYAVYVPPPALCTDNAATVAGVAFHRFQSGQTGDLAFDAYARRVR
jgi:N6-L-threonylcarbamoyladenine synthase